MKIDCAILRNLFFFESMMKIYALSLHLMANFALSNGWSLKCWNQRVSDPSRSLQTRRLGRPQLAKGKGLRGVGFIEEIAGISESLFLLCQAYFSQSRGLNLSRSRRISKCNWPLLLFTGDAATLPITSPVLTVLPFFTLISCKLAYTVI